MSILGKNLNRTAGVTHTMTPNDVMNVGKGIPTPWNPGDRSEVRTEQVRTRHKNFTQKEADDLRVKAAQRTHQAKVNAQGYQALKKIENADRSDHTNYRNYQTTVAKVAAGKKGADVASAKAMNGVATKYAQMGYSLGASNHETSNKVAEFQALYTGVSRKWA
jgi:hypothetical protein